MIHLTANNIVSMTGYVLYNPRFTRDEKHTMPMWQTTGAGERYIPFRFLVNRGSGIKHDVDYIKCWAYTNTGKFMHDFIKHKTHASIVGTLVQASVQLDDKECPHCGKVLSSRFRDWYHVAVVHINPYGAPAKKPNHFNEQVEAGLTNKVLWEK